MQFLKPHPQPQALSIAVALLLAGVSAITHAQSSPMVEVATAAEQVPTESNDRAETVRVVVPYIEMHLRPHRYFPVFFVVKRDEWLTIIDSQGDFLLVRSPNGQEGWVLREELDSSLRAAGIGKKWRDQVIDDYIIKHLTLGVGLGRLSTEARGQLWAGYALTDMLSIEGSLNQMYGKFAGAGMWQLDLVAFPWSGGGFSPYAGIGVGQLRNYADHRTAYTRAQNSSTFVAAPKATAYQLNLRAGLDYKLGEHYGVRIEGAYYAALHVGHAAPTFDSLVSGTSNYTPSSDHKVGNFSSLMASFSYSF